MLDLVKLTTELEESTVVAVSLWRCVRDAASYWLTLAVASSWSVSGLGVWRLADAPSKKDRLVRRDIVVGAGWAGVTAAALFCMAGASVVFRKLGVARVAAVELSAVYADPGLRRGAHCAHISCVIRHACTGCGIRGASNCVLRSVCSTVPGATDSLATADWTPVLHMLEIGDVCGGLCVGGQPACAWQQCHSSREFGYESVCWSC